MPTLKQLAANRLSTRKTTGPHLVESKGIRETRAPLAAEFHEEFSLSNPLERFLVDTLIRNELRLRELRSLEADLQCVIDSCQHNYRRALKGLQRLQANGPTPPEAA
jgi:hypothetical protein